MDIFRSVIESAAGGLLLERLRRKRDQIADPLFVPEDETEHDLLRDIRDTLFAYMGQNRPAPRPLRYLVTLFVFPDGGYPVVYEGRTRMNIQVAADTTVFVDGRIGQFTLPIKKGWNNVDLGDGSRLYMPNATTTANVYIEYANYAHGNSI